MNYNLGQFIGETIKSVLDQTFTDFEYLIYDDASTDNSMEIIKSFDDPRIRIIPLLENSGNPLKIVNMAMKEAKGEYFTILPSDDVWETTFLEKTIGKLEADPVFGMVNTHFSFIDEESRPYGKPHPLNCLTEEPNRTQDEWLKLLYSGNRFRTGGVIRASLNIGEFDLDLAQLGDLDFYIRGIKKTPVYIIPEKLIKIRDRGDNNLSAPTPANNIKHLKNLGIIQRKHYRKHSAESLQGKLKLIIATPFYEMKGFSPYIVSLLKTARYLDSIGMDWEFWEVSGSSYVDRARNLLCAKFLESDATHLLFIDSDEDGNWHEAIPAMIAADKDIIGGAYPQKNNWNTWSSIPNLESGDIKGELNNNKSLIEADIVSAGFMLIHRRALEKFEKQYPELYYADVGMDPEDQTRIYMMFFQQAIIRGRYLGEDSTFCDRYKAMGEKLWIYADIDFGHYGIQGWYGNYDTFLRNQK